jgi:hypothetical protein
MDQPCTLINFFPSPVLPIRRSPSPTLHRQPRLSPDFFPSAGHFPRYIHLTAPRSHPRHLPPRAIPNPATAATSLSSEHGPASLLSLSLRRRRAGEARHGGTPLLRLLPPRHPSRSRIRPHDGGGREGEETASSSGGGRPVRGASICAVRDGVSLLHQRELLYSLLTALLPAAMAPPQ